MISLSLVLSLLIKENLQKVLFLEILIWLWYFIGKRTESFTYASLLSIFIALPFNVSIQVFSAMSSPYVNGVFTNYLVPTVSILDLFFALLLFSAIIEGKIKKADFSLEIFLILIFAVIQFFLKKEIVSPFGIFRIALYLTSFRVILREISLKGDRRIVKIAKTLILFEVLIAIFQFVSGSSIGLNFLGESIFSAGMKGSNFLDISGNLYIRGYGTFPHPNILAGWLILMMTILWKEKQGLPFIIVSSIGITFTFSRTGIFLLVIFWAFYIFDKLKEKRNIKFFSFSPILFTRVENLFKGGDSAVIDRVNLFKESLAVFKNNWINGTGYNTFVRAMGENMPKTSESIWLNQPVHNVLLLSLCELGTLGTVLLGIAYWRTFFMKGINIKSVENIFVLLCLISIGMVDHYLFSLPQGLVIGILSLLLISKNGESGIRTHGTH